MKKTLKFLLLLLLACQTAFSQINKFENEILAFEKHDSLYTPQPNANLFVGSSSIKFWKTLEADFEGFRVINRGFGGSNLKDLDFFTERIILKYSPAKIFIYSGENDINDSANEKEVLDRFISVFTKIRISLPNVPIVFISIKPSIARKEQFGIQTAANQLIKTFISNQENAEFVSVVKKMLLKGKPNPSIFIDDKLHMNRKGYEIWTKKLKRYLVK